MSLVGGREPEHLDRTHTERRRMCKLHTEETKNFMLRSNRERNGMYERMNEQRIYRKHGAQLAKVQRHTANVTSWTSSWPWAGWSDWSLESDRVFTLTPFIPLPLSKILIRCDRQIHCFQKTFVVPNVKTLFPFAWSNCPIVIPACSKCLINCQLLRQWTTVDT